MRTKLLKLNRGLPRIESAQANGLKPMDTASPFESSPLRRTQAPKMEMTDMFQAIMKMTQNAAPSY